LCTRKRAGNLNLGEFDVKENHPGEKEKRRQRGCDMPEIQ
jgi:hypothetical protein